MFRKNKTGAEPTRRKLRVLYVIPGADEDITMSFSRRQAASVSLLGTEVRCFFLRSRTSPLEIAREISRLRTEIRRFDPQVIHAHYGTMTAFVCAIASRRPLVITFHGSDLNPTVGDPWLRSIVGRALSHLAALRASRVICVSSPLRQRIVYRRHGVHVVPCGVNLELFRPIQQAACRQQLGWQRDERVVLFNARNDPVGKRLDLAEAAMVRARRKIPNLRLHVFRGKTHPDEMPAYYNAADCLLMTSDYEGSPMVIKEALACNLPVVSVDVGDVVERLSGVTPSAVVVRDPAALGKALVDILNLDIRSNGRTSIQSLSEQSIAVQLQDIYRAAAGMPAVSAHVTAELAPVGTKRATTFRAA